MKAAEKDEVIAIASDHGGYELKTMLIEEIKKSGHRVLDLGTDNLDSVDYPVIASAMVETVESGAARRGVLICGTGIGVSIAANRNKKIRAAVCHSEETARLGRAHNDANVLALGGRVIDKETAKACLRGFLETDFEAGGRHERRVGMLS